MYALNIDTDGRILSATYPKYAPDSAVIVEELPDGDISDYKYSNDTFVFDPLPEPEPETPDSESVTWDELAAAIQEGVDSV